jgi:hypothetical protein
MNGSHCSTDQMQSLIDGTISRTEREIVTYHMRDCPECMVRYQSMLKFDGVLRSLPLTEAGSGFTDAVMAKLDLSLPATRAFRFFTWIAYQLGLIVVAGLMAGVFVLTGLIGPEQLETGQSVAGEALGYVDGFLSSGLGLITAWLRSVIPVPSSGSLGIFCATVVVLLLLLLVDRNLSRRSLQRTR